MSSRQLKQQPSNSKEKKGKECGTCAIYTLGRRNIRDWYYSYCTTASNNRILIRNAMLITTSYPAILERGREREEPSSTWLEREDKVQMRLVVCPSSVGLGLYHE